MIVERRMHKVKPFCEQATLDFLREVWATIELPNMHRLYRPISGPINVIYQEMEFKDWQEREQFWADFFALPQMPQWTEKWQELIRPGDSIEFFSLAE